MSGAVPPLPKYAFMALCSVKAQWQLYFYFIIIIIIIIIRAIKSRRMRWAGHVTRIRAMRNSYKILVGKPEGNRPLG
jgi:type II secretory pathway component PulF